MKHQSILTSCKLANCFFNLANCLRIHILIFFVTWIVNIASGQNLTISGENLVTVFGVHQIGINANLILYFDYVDANSDPDDISKIKVLYTDKLLNAYDSLSFEGDINDSLKLVGLSPSKFKNGKIYFTQNSKNRYNDNYYIEFCSYDPLTKVFQKYGKYMDQKLDLIHFYTLATSNDSTDYIYYGTAFKTKSSIATFPQLFLLFNTSSKKYEIPTKQLEMSTILQKDFSYYFLYYIYKYDMENKNSELFKFKYVHAGFGGEAYGNKIDNSLYINGRMNGLLGASMTKYDIGLNNVIVKYFEMYDETCIIPAVSNDEVQALNEKLYLPFTTIDPRLCNILEVVYYDSPP